MYLQLYDQRAIDDVIARCNGHRGTSVLKEATRQEPQITKSDVGDPDARARPPRDLPEPVTNRRCTPPTTANACPTSTGPRTA